MVNVNNFTGGSDNDIIEKAIRERDADGIVVIPPRQGERCFWLLDRAILLPENTTVILQNCTVKLSDRCRDNFFRTANCGIGMTDPAQIHNIHLRGEGSCVLRGADHPRATGDSSKILSCPCPFETEDLCRLADWIPEERKKSGKLEFWDYHNHSFGTDAGKEGESQTGDWRGIGILFAACTDFSIENLKIEGSHGWGISLEACCDGRVEKIVFDACMSKEIDGMRQNMENQDGIDIRNGCHRITISDISGRTGDDLIALTAIAQDNAPLREAGSLTSTHVLSNDWTKRDRDIGEIVIRNVTGYSHVCYIIRLLPAGAVIRNIIIDGVMDTSPENVHPFGSILLGAPDGDYGQNLPGSLTNLTLSNIICDNACAIEVAGYLTDSVIGNVINRRANAPAILVKRKDGMRRVATAALRCDSETPIAGLTPEAK